MAYKRGWLNKYIGFTSLDGRNSIYPHYSHRVTIRSRIQEYRFRDILASIGVSYEDIESLSMFNSRKFHKNEPIVQKPVVYWAETRFRSVFYMNEDTLVMLVMAYPTDEK